jgi:hypothetical protein
MNGDTSVTQAKSILYVWLSVLTLIGGCCFDHADLIPRSKLPYAIYNKGIKYYLVDHVSIDQMKLRLISEETAKNRLLSELRQRFANNKDLVVYLDGIDQHAKKVYQTEMQIVSDIGVALENAGGELYAYKVLGKEGDIGDGQVGVGVEEGWLILSNGKVIKTYVVGSGGLENIDVLKQEGLVK